MGDNVESDLLYEDFQNEDQKDFNNDNYGQEDDLYDDVLTSGSNNLNNSDNNVSSDHAETETNGNYQGGMHSMARRFQLYIGNLTWWTTDQDIGDAVVGTGVSDFQEVKFFENRANGQSKGFCVITLGSEGSMRIVMENLPKKELNGQTPIVTLPTKQALNQFESQQKTRPTPPVPPNGQKPMQGNPMGMNPNIPPQGNNMHPRMMNPMMRGPMPMQNNPMPMRMGNPNVPPPMNHPNAPQMNNMPPRFQNNWNNGHPRPGNPGMQGNRPPPGMMNHQGPPGMMNQQGPPMMNRPPMSGNRPFGPNRQMHPGNFNQGPQNMNNMGNPRVPMNMGGPPAPHVNPAFFNQGVGPMQVSQQGPPSHFNPQQGPRPQGMWPQQGNKMPPFEGQNQPPPTGPAQPPISEAEFEEIMGRNRTVSSSAIARAVSDAAAGEYTSAMETLATAISLIKQSKVANDERCKILITSLQDTLQGIEAKSYNRRERSDRSRSRERRRRRERSNSRSYRRSRSREHRDHRERGGRGDDRYYGSENYHSSRETRERSRSRDRGNAESHYRGGEER
ncbi:hypothetical protein ACKWTF_009337 [Chironomus riparius]